MTILPFLHSCHTYIRGTLKSAVTKILTAIFDGAAIIGDLVKNDAQLKEYHGDAITANLDTIWSVARSPTILESLTIESTVMYLEDISSAWTQHRKQMLAKGYVDRYIDPLIER